MRESEDRVEFKAGEGGNVSYDGRGKTNLKDRRRCILGYVIALCNEGGGRLVIGMHDKETPFGKLFISACSPNEK